MVVNWFIPTSKLSGKMLSTRSSGVFSRYVETICAPTTTLWWVSMIPLGIPVEPEV